MSVSPVKNAVIWRHLKILFMGASLIFLINIFFGFDNALTVGEIPRWQILIHLHGGSIGWITLSAIGIAIWVLTGQRDVSETYERRVSLLIWAAVIVFARIRCDIVADLRDRRRNDPVDFSHLLAATATGATRNDHCPHPGGLGIVGGGHRGYRGHAAGHGTGHRSLLTLARWRSRRRACRHDGHLSLPRC